MFGISCSHLLNDEIGELHFIEYKQHVSLPSDLCVDHVVIFVN